MTVPNIVPRILVTASGDPRRGFLAAGGLMTACALGRSGIARRKREGDGATPAGRFHIRAAFYRPDRVRRPRTAIPLAAIEPDLGWCDDPADRAYNRPVDLPYRGRHERLWRDDGLYDIVAVIDFNLIHPRRGAGSAVFLHIAGPGFAPTEGCVAVSIDAMRRLLARIGPRTVLDIA